MYFESGKQLKELHDIMVKISLVLCNAMHS